ncbi:hypothetical protein GCM10022243_38160 [Saccharothrix violaceirubra]|uniref:Protein kinase domain-containing protein n=1 Tax=Saccharothrix violaceirubra TaxID=413306 RepID=A0A7W7T6U1_9PSEU|nr:hypothetical protein [Saccharothrix violaceirubra]MBB4966270.1 hypothetical protein [Saccharothrix violaceirubra]
MTDRTPDEYDGHDPDGRPRRWWLTPVAPVDFGDSVLSTTLVRDTDDIEYVLRVVPSGGGIDAERALDNEIRALLRLHRRYAHDHPAELPGLVGYGFDAATQFALLAARQGVVDGHRTATLLTDHRRAYVAGLFRALDHVGAAGLVHGGLGPATVRWNGETAVVVNFEHALSAGERARPGTPPVHPGDDVRAGGLIAYRVLTGREPAIGRADFLATAPPEVAALLADVFHAEPGSRPSAAEVSGRLAAAGAPAAPVDEDAGLAEGRVRFDRRHRATPPDPVSESDEEVAIPAPVAKRVRGRDLLMYFVLVVAVVALVLAAALGRLS